MQNESETKTPGRDNAGKFTKGNKAAKKRDVTYTRKAAKFRKILYECVTDNDFRKICNKMKEDAINGTARDREIFMVRLLGTPGTGIDILERMEKLETLLKEQEEKEAAENDLE